MNRARVVYFIVVAAVVLTGSMDAQTAARGTLTTSAAPSCGDRIKLDGFTISPTNPRIGETVTVSMAVHHLCASGDPLNIRWSFWAGGYEIGQGTANVAASSSVTVTRTWTAKGGAQAFYSDIDPSRVISDSNQTNNRSQTINVTVNTDWSAVRTQTESALQQTLNDWNNNARLKDVTIQGPLASGGKIVASSLSDALRPNLTGKGVPAELAHPIADAISEQWKRWSDSVRVPNLPWYPTFAVAPVDPAPATPNAPTNLSLLQQDSSSVRTGAIAAAISNKLGALASLSGASGAVDGVAAFTAECHGRLAAGMVNNVIGTGPVPTIRNVLLPTPGPVTNGRGNQTGRLSAGGC